MCSNDNVECQDISTRNPVQKCTVKFANKLNAKKIKRKFSNIITDEK